jgi:glucokinase
MTGQHGSPVLAADIGGTKIIIALVSESGRILAEDRIPTLPDEGVSAVIERLFTAIDGLLGRNLVKSSELHGISIACAGGIDTERGVVVTSSPNLSGWYDIPLKDIMEERYKVDTFVLNDASAAALGEQQFGAGKGVANLVLVTVGTGIGGGIITNGRLYLGARGGAGEIGHMTIDVNGPDCGCGSIGCLERLASGTAIARDAIQRIEQGEKSSLAEMAGGEVENITTEMIGTAARNGDPLAVDVLSKGVSYLATGIVNLVNIFDPEMVIIGGGMAEMGDLIIDPVKKMVAERTFSIAARSTRIVTAQLGNRAGVYGAAAFAFQQADRRTE